MAAKPRYWRAKTGSDMWIRLSEQRDMEENELWNAVGSAAVKMPRQLSKLTKQYKSNKRRNKLKHQKLKTKNNTKRK